MKGWCSIICNDLNVFSNKFFVNNYLLFIFSECITAYDVSYEYVITTCACVSNAVQLSVR